MEDKELIELAAKAAGMKVNLEQQLEREALGFCHVGLWIINGSTRWNPLTDDGDAFRLAVNLGLDIEWQHDSGYVKVYRNKPFSAWNGYISELFCVGDAMAATRRAITRAAAQIGKEME